MDRTAGTSLLVLMSVLLALAGPVAAGTMKLKATFSAGVGIPDTVALNLRRLMTTRLEDGVAPELTVDLELHRRVLAGNVNSKALNPDGAACIRSCPAPGRPYTGRGCKGIYQCPH